MTQRRLAFALALVVVAELRTGSALADGDATQALTALPWNGVFLKVSDAEKRGTLEYGQNISALRYHVVVSAPIDGNSRRAAFTDNTGLASGVSLGLSVNYSSILADAGANVGPPSDSCKAFAAAADKTKGVPACDGKEYEDFLGRWLGRNPIPARKNDSPFFWEAGIDLAGSFDKLSVYHGDAASDSEDVKKWRTKLGLNARLYFAPWFALTLKPGIEWSKTPSTMTFTRCENIPSENADVTGSSCSDEALLLLANHKTSTKPYLQWALTGIVPTTTAAVNPGAEVGMLWETSGGVERRHITATAFLTPTNQPVVARFGVGLDVSQALDDDPQQRFKAGKQWWTPFIVVGGTL